MLEKTYKPVIIELKQYSGWEDAGKFAVSEDTNKNRSQ